MSEKYVVAIDLGGTKIYTGLVDFEGNIKKEIKVDTEADKGVDKIVENIKNTISYVIKDVKKDSIKAIGIGSPGPLNVKKGIIQSPPNLPFKNYNIVEVLEKEFDIPTFLDNDANCATLAEHLFGKGKGLENLVYITVSTGIGAGAILNGKIYRGSTSNALEVGHTTIEGKGAVCGCGNFGCSEALSSGTAIAKRGREIKASNAYTTLKNYDNITAREVFEESSKGDIMSKIILEDALRNLGILVSNVANSFDPEMIILGGGVINGGGPLMEIINEEVNKRVLEPIRENLKIEISNLEGKSGCLGAAALAIISKK